MHLCLHVVGTEQEDNEELKRYAFFSIDSFFRGIGALRRQFSFNLMKAGRSRKLDSR